MGTWDERLELPGMGDEQADRIVDAVLRELNGRGGFDHWWGNIDHEIREEIRETLRRQVQAA